MGFTIRKNGEQGLAATDFEAFITFLRIVSAVAASAFVLLSAQLVNAATEDYQPRLLREARELASANRDRCDFSCSMYSDSTSDLETCFKMQNRCETGLRKSIHTKRGKKIVSR